jgi:MATE family multidrug resistance protein
MKKTLPKNQWLPSLYALVKQAFPIYIGQMAVILYGVIDSIMAGRSHPEALAVLALAGGVYMTCAIGFGGIVFVLNPLVAHDFGAKKYYRTRIWLFQSIWPIVLVTLLSVLIFYGVSYFLPRMNLSQEITQATKSYLFIISLAMPAAFMLRALYAINTAILNTSIVMLTQLLGLLIKIPLNYLFIYSNFAQTLSVSPSDACAISSTLTYWILCLGLLYHALYRVVPSQSPNQSWWQELKPNFYYLYKLLAMGIPSTLIIFTEVAAFTLMAWFIAPFGAIQTAAHQVAVSFAGVVYMIPLSIAIATATLTSQQLGARQANAAKQIALTGLGFGSVLSILIGILVAWQATFLVSIYTKDALVIQFASTLLLWVGVYQLFDAVQAISCHILRCYRITVLPMFIYAISMLVVAFTIGYASAHQWGFFASTPILNRLYQAHGYWFGVSMGLAVAAIALSALLWRVFKAPPPDDDFPIH